MTKQSSTNIVSESDGFLLMIDSNDILGVLVAVSSNAFAEDTSDDLLNDGTNKIFSHNELFFRG